MTEAMQDPNLNSFKDLGLPEHLLAALAAVGYESPSPIQSETIPPLLAGRDVLGQAQTGTGKTAAFALPILAELNLRTSAKQNPQALVLAPTRELAIQVAEAFQKYANQMPGFLVLPIYGGQSYTPQLKGLQRGAHVVVGTPGRVIDHLEKGSLDLSNVTTLVLDEADEMLRMGFVDDVETILQRIPAQRRIALFSATMPRPIARIAETYLRDPVRVSIVNKTTTAANIRQRYWQVSGFHKLDALTRILEVEDFDGMIVFSRTKIGTEDLAQKLEARGFSAAAINGDMPQVMRERTINRLKDGNLDILVATDVAARGLDVDRISHVVNFDIPVDTESYVHRIGRTGRAGRTGDAILFVTPRERHLLRAIERATRQPIEAMTLPSIGDVNTVRITRFKQQISDTLAEGNLDQFRAIIESFETEQNVPAIEIATALAKLSQGGKPLLLNLAQEFTPRITEREEKPRREPREFSERPAREFSRPERTEREPRVRSSAGSAYDSTSETRPKFGRGAALDDAPVERAVPRRGRDDSDKQTYKIAVGSVHDVKPGSIVGAIANEVGLDSQYIGRIEIFEDYSLVDLPDGMPDETFQHLKKVRVAGQRLMIEAWDGKSEGSKRSRDDVPTPFAKRSKFSAPAFDERPTRSYGDKPARSFEKPSFDKPAGTKKTFGKPFSERGTDKPAGKVFKKPAASSTTDSGFSKPKKPAGAGGKVFKPGKKY